MIEKKELLRPSYSIYLFNWIFGIGVIQYPRGVRHPIISLVYSLLHIVVYCTLSGIAYPYLIALNTVVSDSTAIKIIHYANIFLMINTIILGWYKSQVLDSSIAKIGIADTLMEHIGVPKNYGEIFKGQMLKMFLSFSYTLIIISINSVILFSHNVPIDKKILMATVICIPVVIMFIADATFTSIVSYITYKLMKLNRELKNISSTTFDIPQHKKLHEFHYVEQKFLAKNPIVVLKTAKQAHLKLVEASHEANRAYEFQILVSIAVAFAAITGNAYNTYILLTSNNISQEKISKAISTSIIWTSYYAIKIIWISWICSVCMETAVKTGDVINEAYDEPFISKEAQGEIRNFNVQLIQRPLKFTSYGFLDLDFTLVQMMIGAITTYLMILIQLGNNFDETHCHCSSNSTSHV